MLWISLAWVEEKSDSPGPSATTPSRAWYLIQLDPGSQHTVACHHPLKVSPYWSQSIMSGRGYCFFKYAHIGLQGSQRIRKIWLHQRNTVKLQFLAQKKCKSRNCLTEFKIIVLKCTETDKRTQMNNLTISEKNNQRINEKSNKEIDNIKNPNRNFGAEEYNGWATELSTEETWSSRKNIQWAWRQDNLNYTTRGTKRKKDDKW